MRYLSVCSGIEAASVAWHPLGWTPAAFSEMLGNCLTCDNSPPSLALPALVLLVVLAVLVAVAVGSCAGATP
jgi:hypothetical protein